MSLAHRITALLPPSMQAKLPASLLAHNAHHVEDAEADSSSEEGPDDTPTPAARNNRNKVSQLKKQERLAGKKANGANGSNGVNGSGAASPDESAATTEVDSADEEDEVEVAGTDDKKAKKKGLGKAGAARRRKMGMKK